MRQRLIPWTLAAVLLGAVLPGAAQAEAPAVKTQAAGYYRQALGDFEVTVLLDGPVPEIEIYENAFDAC